MRPRTCSWRSSSIRSPRRRPSLTMSHLPLSRKTLSSADGLSRLSLALAALLLGLAVDDGAAQSAAAAPDLKTHIANLSALEFPTRSNAARMIRRAAAAQAVPALSEAVAKHPDEFVRYRAFIVLSSFNDRGTADLVRGLLKDRNDRLREAAYKWLEANPDPALAAALLASLQTEQAEFVRPALRSEERRVGKECRSRWSPDQ